jgi:hypothetical protein
MPLVTEVPWDHMVGLRFIGIVFACRVSCLAERLRSVRSISAHLGGKTSARASHN